MLTMVATVGTLLLLLTMMMMTMKRITVLTDPAARMQVLTNHYRAGQVSSNTMVHWVLNVTQIVRRGNWEEEEEDSVYM